MTIFYWASLALSVYLAWLYGTMVGFMECRKAYGITDKAVSKWIDRGSPSFESLVDQP